MDGIPKLSKGKLRDSKTNCYEVKRLFNLYMLKAERVCNISNNKIKIKNIFSFIDKYTLTNNHNRNKSYGIQISEYWNYYNLTYRVIQKNNACKDGSKSDKSFENVISNPLTDSKKLEQTNLVSSTFNNSDGKKFLDAPILLVDDEEDILTVFRIFLQSEGYNNIAAFSSSKEALDHISSLKDLSYYKLALIDIKMPEINGERLYQILKIINPGIKVIFLTSFSNVDDLIGQHPEIQQKDILRKPIERKEFIKIINYNFGNTCNS
ncbi:MAG: response regulator [Candidatus Nitrosocosmicus sp.]